MQSSEPQFAVFTIRIGYCHDKPNCVAQALTVGVVPCCWASHRVQGCCQFRSCLFLESGLNQSVLLRFLLHSPNTRDSSVQLAHDLGLQPIHSIRDKVSSDDAKIMNSSWFDSYTLDWQNPGHCTRSFFRNNIVSFSPFVKQSTSTTRRYGSMAFYDHDKSFFSTSRMLQASMGRPHHRRSPHICQRSFGDSGLHSNMGNVGIGDNISVGFNSQPTIPALGCSKSPLVRIPASLLTLPTLVRNFGQR